MTGPSCGYRWSTPLMVSEFVSMLRDGPAPTCGWVLCCGTVPSMWIDLSVNPPAAALTPLSVATCCTRLALNVCCGPATNVSRENCEPGVPRLGSVTRPPGPGGPVGRSDRVTDMSVPTPVSGFSTFACASFNPLDSALAVTTSPTPTPRPSA